MVTHINLILLPYCQVCPHLSKHSSSSTLETWVVANPCYCCVFAASCCTGLFCSYVLGHLSSPLMESEGQDHLLFFQSKLLADGASVSTAIQRHGSREGFSTPRFILSPSPSSGASMVKGGMDFHFIHCHILCAGYKISKGGNRRVILLRLSGTY